MKREYQICKRCVMDTTDPDIIFDENGICDYCTDAIKRLKEIYFIDPEEKRKKLKQIVEKIKSDGKNKKYDCIIGLSGGVDSSYLAYVVVKELGLRPLAVHLDNGWNSELAVMNIESIVNKLGIDLITHVIDWEEFKSLQLAFLKSSVVDLELLSDHAIGVVNAKIARKYKLKFYISGSNISTESIMPSSWFYSSKRDSLNIKDIFKKHGNGMKFKTYPFISFYRFLFDGKDDVKKVPLLNYIEYKKNEAVKILKDEFEWRDYGGKHLESKITKIYQSYILPIKFNIDKRKAHLSSEICSGQLSRNDAITKLKEPLYLNTVLESDLEFFLKKIGLSVKDFEVIMNSAPKSHFDFKSYAEIKNKIYRFLKPIHVFQKKQRK